jgi:hypothetical protein
MIPEIDIWRAAQLMLKRYGDKALEESAARADELSGTGDHVRAQQAASIASRSSRANASVSPSVSSGSYSIDGAANQY